VRRRRCAEQFDLAALGTSSGYLLTVLTWVASRRVSAIVRTPPPPWLAAAAADEAAASRPDSLRSAVCAKPVVSPFTTRMPAPRSRPLVTCSIRPSSSPADVDRLSSTNTSANSAPVRTAVAEHLGEHILVDHLSEPTERPCACVGSVRSGGSP
jgi:hypothetical protein